MNDKTQADICRALCAFSLLTLY